MRIDPEIARLRRIAAAQPLTDAALSAWRAGPKMAAIARALERYDAGEALGALPELDEALTDHASACALADGLISPLMAALRAEPLAQLPLTHSAAPGLVRLRLASSGGAALTLAAYARCPAATPQSALFEDCEAHDIVIAGAARALSHHLVAGRLHSAAIECAPATCLVRHDATSARQFVEVSRPLLVLQLTRVPARPAPSREIALADGRVLKTISGCRQTSQKVMALAVLGALAHRPALDPMAIVAQDTSAARDLRWEALRQVLALDPGRGLALLAVLAGAAGDPLRAPATALQQHVLATRPDLAALVPEPV